MGIIFTYRGRQYASIPVLPICVGSQVLVVSASVGFVQEGLQFRKHIGTVEDICQPGTSHHYWWRYPHGEGYVKAPLNRPVFQLVFEDGDIGVYLETDLLHVAWLSRDVHPLALPLDPFHSSPGFIGE